MKKTTGLFSTRILSVAFAAALFCLILWIGMNAFAGETNPCADDIAKLCKDVKPGGGRLAKCLKEHENELSPACKEKIAEAGKKMQELRQACKGDVERLCKDVKPGGGRLVKCLKEHESELSPECKAKIAELRKEKGQKKSQSD